MKKITVNNKEYGLERIKAMDFNGICELEELGLSMNGIKKTQMTSVRALLAYAGNITAEEAGAQIMEHIKNGGSFEDVAPLITTFTESDFFQATRQPDKAEETPTSEGTAQP